MPTHASAASLRGGARSCLRPSTTRAGVRASLARRRAICFCARMHAGTNALNSHEYDCMLSSYVTRYVHMNSCIPRMYVCALRFEMNVFERYGRLQRRLSSTFVTEHSNVTRRASKSACDLRVMCSNYIYVASTHSHIYAIYITYDATTGHDVHTAPRMHLPIYLRDNIGLHTIYHVINNRC